MSAARSTPSTPQHAAKLPTLHGKVHAPDKPICAQLDPQSQEPHEPMYSGVWVVVRPSLKMWRPNFLSGTT